MGISDKDAFRILGLPLGADRDAINERYKSLTKSLSASKLPEDKKRLEQVVAAHSQLLPPPPSKTQNKQNNRSNFKSHHSSYNDSDDGSSEEEWRVLCRNGDARNHIANANHSQTGAEKERKKADKRRAKKKRRKEKKKIGKNDSGSDEDEEDEEEEGLDPNSAFATAAAKKLGGYGAMSKHEDKGKNHTKGASKEEDGSLTNIDPVVLQSRQLAIRGNEAASVGQYSVAVKLFTDAIRLDSNDHRFFGNRSYCYDQLGQHEKALKDAEKAIKIAPQWPKGHYRRGTSLKGLGKYIDAESAFEEVLRLDKSCQEARDEIHKVRIIRIIEMGFTERQAKSAISKYLQVQPALDALLAGEFKESMEDVFYSDDEDDFSKRVKMPQAPKTGKMNMRIGSCGETTLVTGKNTTTNVGPRNPEGLTSLWVGNVVPEVTEKMLSQLFSKQGHVTSVRLLKEKYCAFVNYANKAAAGRAMETLQGYDLCGQRLLIKFPDNPIVNGAQNIILRKPKPPAIKNNVKVNGVAGGVSSNILYPQNQSQTQLQPNTTKLKGPVNGDECYFWRTTGCVFGEACKHKHIPNNKGIDRKPWQM